MAKGRRSVGQRLGLLTGLGLIVGGVLGWAWSLLQSPGAPAPAVETPRDPEPSTPEQAFSTPGTAAGAAGSESAPTSIEILVEPGEVAVIDREPLEASPNSDGDDGEGLPTPDPAATEADSTQQEAAAAEPGDDAASDGPGSAGPASDGTGSDGPASAEQPPAEPPPAEPPTSAVPDAVKAIRAAAAAARERLDAPAKATPPAAYTVTENAPEIG